jgi:hypothetical protein
LHPYTLFFHVFTIGHIAYPILLIYLIQKNTKEKLVKDTPLVKKVVKMEEPKAKAKKEALIAAEKAAAEEELLKSLRKKMKKNY